MFLISLGASRKMQMVPMGLQNVYESIISAILSVAKDIIGEELARKYFPLAGTIALYVFFLT